MRALAACCLIALLAGPARGQAPRQPVLLDTDLGTDVDDAFALALLLPAPSWTCAASVPSAPRRRRGP